MKLIVGLGNPGQKYAQHRHNVGFMAVDQIANDHQIAPWREKMGGLIAVGKISSHSITLLKPQTYMNDSGRSVGAIMRFYKITSEDVIVIHDEIDLAPGRLKAKSGGGTAGHNGLRSIQAHIGEPFTRVRIGVGHPGRKDLVHHHVLHDFAKGDAQWRQELLAKISQSIHLLAEGHLQAFTNDIGQARPSARPTSPKIDQPLTTFPDASLPETTNWLSRLAAKFNRPS